MDDELIERLRAAAPPPGPSVEALAAVVERANRSRRHVIAALVSAGALVGAGLGLGLTASRSPRRLPSLPEATLSAQLAAAVVASAPATPNGTAASATPVGPTFDRLFVRTTADRVDVRAYLVSPEPAFRCSTDHLLLTALSDVGAVVNGISPLSNSPSTKPLEVVGAGGFGQREGSPATWLALRAGDRVARVRATFEDGHTDEMAPVDHLVVLAHTGNDARSSVAAFAADGSEVVALTFPQAGERPPAPPDCRPSQPGAGPGAGPAQQGAGIGAFGILRSTSASSLTMQVQGPSSLAGRTIIVSVPANTPVVRNGQPSSLSALEAGDQVALSMMRDASGYTAERVEARSSPPPAPSPTR